MQVFFKEEQAVRWEFLHDPFQQLDMASCIAVRTREYDRLPHGQLDATMRPDLISATVVRPKGRMMWPLFPHLAMGDPDR